MLDENTVAQPDPEQPAAVEATQGEEPQQQAQQQQQPPQIQVAIRSVPEGLLLTVTPVPVNIVLGDEVLRQIAAQYVAAHADFADELVKMRVDFLRQQKHQQEITNAIKQGRPMSPRGRRRLVD